MQNDNRQQPQEQRWGFWGKVKRIGKKIGVVIIAIIPFYLYESRIRNPKIDDLQLMPQAMNNILNTWLFREEMDTKAICALLKEKTTHKPVNIQFKSDECQSIIPSKIQDFETRNVMNIHPLTLQQLTDSANQYWCKGGEHDSKEVYNCKLYTDQDTVTNNGYSTQFEVCVGEFNEASAGITIQYDKLKTVIINANSIDSSKEITTKNGKQYMNFKPDSKIVYDSSIKHITHFDTFDHEAGHVLGIDHIKIRQDTIMKDGSKAIERHYKGDSEVLGLDKLFMEECFAKRKVDDVNSNIPSGEQKSWAGKEQEKYTITHTAQVEF